MTEQTTTHTQSHTPSDAGWALSAAGRETAEAYLKEQDAGRYAPDRQRLHQKWGEALSYLGRKAEAAKQFSLTRSLDG